jgi:hypothetical protein
MNHEEDDQAKASDAEEDDPPQPRRCTCGIEVRDADRLCTEPDCPFRRYPLW